MQDICSKDGLNGGVPMRMTGQADESLQWAGEDLNSDVLNDAMNCSIFRKGLLYSWKTCFLLFTTVHLLHG